MILHGRIKVARNTKRESQAPGTTLCILCNLSSVWKIDRDLPILAFEARKPSRQTKAAISDPEQAAKKNATLSTTGICITMGTDP